MIAQTHSLADDLWIWWELHGALSFDVVTYYGICAAVGAIQGKMIAYELGCLVARMLL